MKIAIFDEQPDNQSCHADIYALRRVAAKNDCSTIAAISATYIKECIKRFSEYRIGHGEMVIAIISADDAKGLMIAEWLAPDDDFESKLKSGRIPILRGLVDRKDMQDVIQVLDEEAAAKLRCIDGIAVIVIYGGVAEAFPACSFQ